MLFSPEVNLERRKSLKMHREFYGESALDSKSESIEGLLKLTGLNIFLKEVETIFDESSLLFLQASELLKRYITEIANFEIESLDTIASISLLGRFETGGDGIGRNADDTVNEKITKRMVETHDGLRKEVNKNSQELSPSAVRFALFITTIQREIIELLKKSQQTKINELEKEEKVEKVVTRHIEGSSRAEHKVVETSENEIKKQQRQRIKVRNKKEDGVFSNLKILFSLAEGALTPTRLGTHEVVNMAMA